MDLVEVESGHFLNRSVEESWLVETLTHADSVRDVLTELLTGFLDSCASDELERISEIFIAEGLF